MMAVTIVQPYASLIIMGARPLEYRKWDYRDYGIKVGEKIVIHAGARRIKLSELKGLLRTADGKARPILQQLIDADSCNTLLPLEAAIGTAVLGEPQSINKKFRDPNSGRMELYAWSWPMENIVRWAKPVPIRGRNFFWSYQTPTEED